MYVSHDLIKNESIESREYQSSIAETAAENDSLVIIPTGLGKTIIALRAAVNVIEEKNGFMLMMAPSKPLAKQHEQSFNELTNLSTTTLTGETRPSKREKIWDNHEYDAVFATPQIIKNDIEANRINLNDINYLVFDEAHRGTGDYAYVYVAERHKEVNDEGLRLGLTASPGGSVDKIIEVKENLYLDTVEARHGESEDVEPYVQNTEINWLELSNPKNITKTALLFKSEIKDILDETNEWLGFVPQGNDVGQGQLIKYMNKIRGKISKDKHPSSKLYKSVSMVAEALKMRHAVDMLETQGPEPCKSFLANMEEDAMNNEGGKATQRLVSKDVFHEFRDRVEKLSREETDFIKQTVVKNMLKNKLEPGSRAIVFTHYRNTAQHLTKQLRKEDEIEPFRFVGQTNKGENDKGLSQNQQEKLLNDFKNDMYNVMVGTSVSEEGLDIPSADLVVFYEPVASAIRSIQRKGRTGRTREGEVVILINLGTKDEGVYWACKRRESNMEELVKELSSNDGEIESTKQTKLTETG